MQKLFDAIKEEHPDCEVMDVRFTINPAEVDRPVDMDKLDEDLAKAYREAEPLTLGEMAMKESGRCWEIYCRDGCGPCDEAIEIIKEDGRPYRIIKITPQTRHAIIEQLANRLGYAPTSVPQIFMYGTHVGGRDELKVKLNK